MDRRCKQALILSNDIDYGNALMTNFRWTTNLGTSAVETAEWQLLINVFRNTYITVSKEKWRTRIQLKSTLPVHKHLAMQIPLYIYTLLD